MTKNTIHQYINKKNIFKILETVFCLTALFLSVRLLDLLTFDKKMYCYCSAMFIAMALAEASKALSFDLTQKTDRFLRFLYAALYSVAGLIILFVESLSPAIRIVSMIVVVILTIQRVASLIRQHTLFGIIFFIVFLGLMILWTVSIFDKTPFVELILFLVLALVIMSLTLIKIIAISLSRLKYESM